MSEICLWNVVEAVQDACKSEAEVLPALVDLLLSEEEIPPTWRAESPAVREHEVRA
jgi:hypothetical protein